jgi:hypothetical protein
MPVAALQNIGLSEGWAEGDLHWGSEMNRNLRALDLFAQAVSVISMIISVPPAHAAGAAYVIPAGATGAWAGHTGKVARSTGAAWELFTPKTGWLTFNAADGLLYAFRSGSWEVLTDADGTLAANSASRLPTQSAMVTYIAQKIADLVASSPATLDTLDELAAALGDDANFAATVTTALGLRAPLASPALTGAPTAPTPATSDSSTKLATTEFVKAVHANFGIGVYFPGVIPLALYPLYELPMVESFTLPVNFAGAQGRASAPAAALCDFDVKKNGVSIGTVRYALGATTPTFIAASSPSFVPGDVMSVIGPATPDTTLAGVGVTFLATRT